MFQKHCLSKTCLAPCQLIKELLENSAQRSDSKMTWWKSFLAQTPSIFVVLPSLNPNTPGNPSDSPRASSFPDLWNRDAKKGLLKSLVTGFIIYLKTEQNLFPPGRRRRTKNKRNFLSLGNMKVSRFCSCSKIQYMHTSTYIHNPDWLSPLWSGWQGDFLLGYILYCSNCRILIRMDLKSHTM